MGINWLEIFWAVVFYAIVSAVLAFVIGYFLKRGMNNADGDHK